MKEFCAKGVKEEKQYRLGMIWSVVPLSIIHFKSGFEAEKQYILPANIAALVDSFGVVEVSSSCLLSRAINLSDCSEVNVGAVWACSRIPSRWAAAATFLPPSVKVLFFCLLKYLSMVCSLFLQ